MVARITLDLTVSEHPPAARHGRCQAETRPLQRFGAPKAAPLPGSAPQPPPASKLEVQR